MSNQPAQSYANHRALPHWSYLVVGVILFGEAGRRVWMAVTAPSVATGWDLLVGLALVVLYYWARRLPQIVQDRTIRLEMHDRLRRLLGDELRPLVGRLTLPQLVALRFASDGELPALTKRVLAGEFASADAIKQAIGDWQADRLRV